MKSAEVRSKVSEFRDRTARGDTDDDCFVPWYIQTVFRIPDATVFERSSSGGPEKRRNWDLGLDGYHFVGEPVPTSLVLIQGKYSDGVSYIAKGFGDFGRLLNFLSNALAGRDIDVPQENHVLTNLRSDLQRLDQIVRSKLELDFRIIHLSDLDKEILLHKTAESRSKLSDDIRKRLRDHISQVDLIGPASMGETPDIIIPQAKYPLNVRFLNPYDTKNGSKMYFGMARLADFVRMYENRREDLFSKNIRYYIKSARNAKSGPAGKIKETLSEICVKKHDGTYGQTPEMFAALHNGISLYSSAVDYSAPSRTESPSSEAEIASIREPYVLNGCQTIKSAFYFKGDKEDILDSARWEQIEVPIRIVETTEPEVVREVTLSNNFQNAVSYSALHANDEDQIALQRRFEERGIFYQRQEGAFDSLLKDRADLMKEKYPNSKIGYIDVVELGRAIMAALGEITYARSPSNIFEIKKAYETCFSTSRTRSITFLTFLVNLYEITPYLLKKKLDLADLKWERGSKKGPPPSRFVNQTFSLFVRYLAKEGNSEFVSMYGRDLCWDDESFQEKVARMLKRKSGIRSALAGWMSLEDDADALSKAFENTKRELRLGDYVNPFEKFSNL